MPVVIVTEYRDIYQTEAEQLILNIQQNEFHIPITIEEQPDLKDIPEFYQKDNGNFWVALNDNRVVGTVALLNIGNFRAVLRKMFVHADFRGKQYGIGQMLLNTMSAYATEKRFTEILLGTTEKFTAAQRFYEKNGFTEISKKSLPREFPVMSVDVKFYRKGLLNNPGINF
jgi:N-acetylglutamate synthase-like GNAT family acetyltransferase